MTKPYHIHNQEAVYFLTFQVVNWVDAFTRKRYRDIVVESFNYCIHHKGLKVYGWVIMSNHVHCILSAEKDLSGIIRDLKRHTSKAITGTIISEPESRRDWMLFQFNIRGLINRKNNDYQFWTNQNHAIELTDTTMITQRLDYIHDNPVRAGIVGEPQHYLYSSAVDYAGGKGLIDIYRVS